MCIHIEHIHFNQPDMGLLTTKVNYTNLAPILE